MMAERLGAGDREGEDQRAWWWTPIECLSIANVCFLRIWTELLTYSPANEFYMKKGPGAAAYLAAAAGVILLGMGGWLGASLLKRLPQKAANVLRWFIAAAVLGIVGNQTRVVLSTAIPALYPYTRQPILSKVGGTGLAMLMGAFCLIVCWSAWLALRKARLMRIFRIALLCLFPLMPLFVGQAAWRALHVEESSGPAPLTASRPSPRQGHQRVLLVIFDEWDFQRTYAARPAGLSMPELDRFRKEAVDLTAARPPADETLVSIPSLIIGTKVSAIQPISAKTAALQLGDGNTVRIDEQTSLFREARNLGANSAIAGWYLPYCRIWGRDVSACDWWDTDAERVTKGRDFRECFTGQFRSLGETGVLSPLGISLATERAARTYREMIQYARQLAADPNYDFVYLHLPVTHAPYFYDRSTQRYDKGNRFVSGYDDHLALLDKTVGVLRSAMEEAGNWNRTTIILTADHSFRNATALGMARDYRVPYIVRLPSQPEGTVWRPPFSTVLTKRLVLQLLKNEIASIDQLEQFLANE